MENQYRSLPRLLCGALWFLLWAGPLLSTGAWAQTGEIPSLQWQRVVDKQGVAVKNQDMKPTSDGGCVVLGKLDNGQSFVRKYNTSGAISWEQPFQGPNGEVLWAKFILPTQDNKYMILGSTDGLDTGYFVAKLNSDGQTEWVKINPSASVFFASAVQAADGSIIVAGARRNPFAASVYRFSANGDLTWERRYGNSGGFNAICRAADGVGYVVSGSLQGPSSSPVLPATFNGSVILKITETGGIVWATTGITVNSSYQALSPSVAKNGCFLVSASMQINNDQTVDTYLVRNDGSTALVNTLSGFRNLEVGIQATNDGGYILGTGVYNSATSSDYFLARYNSNYTLKWQLSGGGTFADYARQVYELPDGSVLAAGYTFSTDGIFARPVTRPDEQAIWVSKFNATSSAPAPVTNTAILIGYAYDCNTGQLTINATGGNGNPLEYRVAGLRDWSANNVFPVPPHQRVGTTFVLEARQFNNYNGLDFFTTACSTTIPPVITPPVGTTVPSGVFVLRTPDFNCTTGKLTALYSNGNGGPVEYRVAGLRDWGTSPDFFVPAHQLVGTTFTLEARLNDGRTATIAFTTSCGTTPPVVTPPTTPTGTTGTLTFAPTTYVCGGGQSGNQLFINLIGINADPANGIDYKIPGLADWQRSNAFAIPTWQANGTTFTLYARRNGNEISTAYTTVCPASAREGFGETAPSWQAMVMPNPVDEQVTVAITGAAGQTADLIISDVTGQQLYSRQVKIESNRHQETFGLARQPAGLYLLRVTMAEAAPLVGCEDIRTADEKRGLMSSLASQSQTVKIIKR